MKTAATTTATVATTTATTATATTATATAAITTTLLGARKAFANPGSSKPLSTGTLDLFSEVFSLPARTQKAPVATRKKEEE